MSDLSIIPLEDWFETQLAQDWNGAVGTVYVLDTPSYTPTTTNTYIVVNPWKTNMQIAEITDYDSTANTLTVSNVTLLKGLGINSTAPASSHATGSKVIISDNYQFWVDIQTAINSKLDDTGGTMTGLLQFSGTTHAGIKLLSLTTVQRDALSASNGMLIYNSTTGELNQYIGGAWSAVAAGSTQPTASTTVLGKIKTDVAPAWDPVALITDNPKYDALAGTSGTPSASNKYVTEDDVATTATASKVARRLAGGNITVVTESQANNSTNAASTAYVDTGLASVALVVKNGSTTYDLSTASGTQTIAHWCWKNPKYVRLKGIMLNVGTIWQPVIFCEAFYDGTTQTSNCLYKNGNPSFSQETNFRIGYGIDATTYQTGTITKDATNISIAWVKTGSPTGTLTIFWEAFAQ